MFNFKNSDAAAKVYFPAFSINHVALKDVQVGENDRGKYVALQFVNPEGETTVRFNALPDGAEERKDFGNGPIASIKENNQVAIAQFIAALNPAYYDKLMSGEATFESDDWGQFVEALAEVFKEGITDKLTYYLKLTDNGFIPSYPAKLKDGELIAKTNIISRNPSAVVFTSAEEKKRNKTERASNASPTDVDNIGDISNIL